MSPQTKEKKIHQLTHGLSIQYPPTAAITSERTYTNGERITIDITFSEQCTGLGGFKCLNSSNCDVS